MVGIAWDVTPWIIGNKIMKLFFDFFIDLEEFGYTNFPI